MKRDNAKGRTLRRGEPGFDDAVLGTSFNARDKGWRPDILIQADGLDDVIRAVHLARDEGLKISICSGGHSWAQNHIREGGLLLDLSRLDHLEIDGERRRAVIGPGRDGESLNVALMKQGLFFPTPHAPGVCMGGFLLQGGFGWGSRALGLGCQNVIGIDAVLADGRLVHASETENPDLFWAARGSGPGFFAVVVRYHLKLHPKPGAIGMVLQVFRMKHLEAVFDWADQAGPSVANTVEFQMLMTPRALGINAPGIEVVTPVLAPDWKTARADTAFLTRSPVRKLASFALPLLPVPMGVMMQTAARTHFPPKMHWCVDNMWTESPMAALKPGLRRIAETLPPHPSHVLWLNWAPRMARPDMAFSMEAERYLALYGEWKSPADDARYAHWATERMQEMAVHSKGIQLADENLARRPDRFVSDPHLQRLDAIRQVYDPAGRFRPWMGRPN